MYCRSIKSPSGSALLAAPMIAPVIVAIVSVSDPSTLTASMSATGIGSVRNIQLRTELRIAVFVAEPRDAGSNAPKDLTMP